MCSTFGCCCWSSFTFRCAPRLPLTHRCLLLRITNQWFWSERAKRGHRKLNRKHEANELRNATWAEDESNAFTRGSSANPNNRGRTLCCRWWMVHENTPPHPKKKNHFILTYSTDNWLSTAGTFKDVYSSTWVQLWDNCSQSESRSCCSFKHPKYVNMELRWAQNMQKSLHVSTFLHLCESI